MQTNRKYLKALAQSIAIKYLQTGDKMFIMILCCSVAPHDSVCFTLRCSKLKKNETANNSVTSLALNSYHLILYMITLNLNGTESVGLNGFNLWQCMNACNVAWLKNYPPSSCLIYETRGKFASNNWHESPKY